MYSSWIRKAGIVLLLAMFGVFSTHCSSGPTTSSNNNTNNTNTPPTNQNQTNVNQTNTNQNQNQNQVTLTYHKDVRTILAKNCVGCHYAGGIGLFPLDSFAQVKTYASAIVDAVKSRRMPPYPADSSSCGQEYHDNPSLEQAEIDKIAAWAKEGSHEGDASAYVKPTHTNLNVGLSRVDLTLKMAEAYIPQKQPDDYRCFVVPWPEKEKKYVSGFQIKAGNPALVHHVIAYVGAPSTKAKFEAKDSADPGPGYTCFGGPGGDAGWLGAWAPGTPGRDYPEGTGIEVQPGSVIIIQMHYNSLQKQPGPDQTTIEMKLESKVDRVAYLLPLAAAGDKKGWVIPAGQSEFTHRQLMDNPLPMPVTIYSVMFHMHLLGKAGRLYIKRKNDTQEESACLLNIPKWDFNWQLAYPLKKPVVVNPGDRVGIECKWNNSAENQAVVDGKRLPPRNVSWGDGSTDEMCLGVVYASY